MNNRIIKFRGKRIDGEWITGGYFNTNETDISPKHYIVTYREGDSALTEWRVRPETVGQFTGMKDKNGTEIYDGDILFEHFDARHHHEDRPCPHRYVVKHGIAGSGDGIGFIVSSLEKIPFNGRKFVHHVGADCVIQGNIHDNPELLEESK